MSMLQVEDLCASYGRHVVFEGLTCTVEEGEWLMLCGPNGSGKSTFVGCVQGSVDHTGTIELMGKDVRTLRPAEMARLCGVLTQHHFVGLSFTVEEVVRLGRYAHRTGPSSARDASDSEHVARALELCGLSGLAGAPVTHLSGGELQRTFLAQLFAQDPALMILDEPTNHLDLVYQKQVFELVRDWLREGGHAVVSVVHDLTLARAFGTRALLLSDGRVRAQGTIEEVFRPSNLDAAYHMDVYAWMRGLYGPWCEDGTPG
jgi:iron complex transport system ATP-binding protein